MAQKSMPYVDGFVLPVPKKKLSAYRRMAQLGGKVWMEHGALQYFECIGEDLAVKMGIPFTKLAKPKPGETVAFSFIVFKSKAHRKAVNAKVMKDPRLCGTDLKDMPFDFNRMSYGGFKAIVHAAQGRR